LVCCCRDCFDNRLEHTQDPRYKCEENQARTIIRGIFKFSPVFMNVDWNKYRIPISAKVDRFLQPEYISELIGTFFLVFTVGVNVLQGKTLAPLSIGAILMSFVFATGWYVCR